MYGETDSLKISSKSLVSDYLSESNPVNRLKLLNKIKSSGYGFPLHLAWDLIELGLSVSEQVEIVGLVQHPDLLYLEDFYTQLTPFVHQDVAIKAFREWYAKTPRRLWYRWLKVVYFPDLPQRLRYTMLDLADLTLSRQLLRCYSKVGSLDDFSEAFLSLLINKALVCDYNHKFYIELSAKLLSEGIAGEPSRQTQRLFLNACCYLRIHDPARIADLPQTFVIPSYLSPLVSPLNVERRKDAQERWKFFKALKEPEQTLQKLRDSWPDIIDRGFLAEADLHLALSTYLKTAKDDSKLNEGVIFFEESFARLREDLIIKAVCALENSLDFARATYFTERLVPYPSHKQLISATIRKFRVTDQPNIFMKCLGKALRFAMEKAHRPDQENLDSDIVLREETFVLQKISTKEPLHTLLSEPFEDIFSQSAEAKLAAKWEPGDRDRHRFFTNYFRNKIIDASTPEELSNDASFWNFLSEEWENPNAQNIEELTRKARAEPYLFQIVFIRYLGKFKQNETAFLKLLDYVRASDYSFLKEVIEALAAIDGPRSAQELVSMLTRPNMDDSLRLEIARVLRALDLSLVQAELRSALSQLRSQSDGSDVRIEALDALELLLVNRPKENKTKKSHKSAEASLPEAKLIHKDEPELDSVLQEKIQGYVDLSSEARRALRSAEFFYTEAFKSSQLGLMDLSPVLDMQFKALELTFRERFENICQQLVQSGVLQRKLDQLGYARPIEAKMADFENYINKLEIVRDIPFFSRFKLRKMLRAICQYRPGKRFTLDGLKAFGLFFLTFGRLECPYGLARILPLAFANDQDLARFCFKLHSFQDLRNRAAHEGFRPDAADDLKAIWLDTSAIVGESSRVLEALGGGQMSLIWSNLDVGVRGFEKAKDVQIVHKSVS